MITEEQRLIILKALRDSYANLTAENMTEKEFDNLTNAMTIVKNCSISDVVGQSEQLCQCKIPNPSMSDKCSRCNKVVQNE
jgi:hypothetical protein